MASKSDDVFTAIRQRLGRNTAQIQRPTGSQIKTGFRLLDDLKSSSGKVRGRSVVEITGNSSSGKTRLLHLLAAKTLLMKADSDKQDNTTPPKPRVCWYDLNGGLDINYMVKILSKHIQSANRDVDSEAASLDMLSHMNVYTTDSLLQLCASLREMCEFLRTSEGSEISCIIIDALGISYYHDKFVSETRMRNGDLPIDITLTQLVRQVFAASDQLVLYCSKCAIFDADKLSVVEWPFKSAGIPLIPRDFMPEAWVRLVSHVILLYHIDYSANENDQCCHRGALALYYRQDQVQKNQRKLSVGAASVIRISDTNVEDTQTHVVG